MRLLMLGILALPMAAQDLRITADLLSQQTTKAMFGKLPKRYAAANVGICNQTPDQKIVPLLRVAQQTRATNGPVLLPRDAAIVVIAAAQGSANGSRALRAAVAAISVASIAAGWSSLSTVWKGVLTDSSIVGTQALGAIAASIPTHIYLTLDRESLPDPLLLPPFGCQAGIVLVETLTMPDHLDFSMPLPR